MSTPNDTRKCKVCKESYPLTDEYFPTYKNRVGKILLRHYCYACWKINRADTRKRRDPEKIKAEKRRNVVKHPEAVKRRRDRFDANHPDYGKEMYEKHKPKIIARVKQWQKNFPEKHKAISKRSYEKHKDKKLAWQKEYYSEHPDIKRAHSKKYRDSHRDQLRQSSIEYNKAHPEQRRRAQADRRARIAGNGGTYTIADIRNILETQQNKCVYCHRDLNGKYHIDHIQPLARGGTNYPDNLACSCAECNLSKGDKTIEEWMATRGW